MFLFRLPMRDCNCACTAGMDQYCLVRRFYRMPGGLWSRRSLEIDCSWSHQCSWRSLFRCGLSLRGRLSGIGRDLIRSMCQMLTGHSSGRSYWRMERWLLHSCSLILCRLLRWPRRLRRHSHFLGLGRIPRGVSEWWMLLGRLDSWCFVHWRRCLGWYCLVRWRFGVCRLDCIRQCRRGLLEIVGWMLHPLHLRPLHLAISGSVSTRLGSVRCLSSPWIGWMYCTSSRIHCLVGLDSRRRVCRILRQARWTPKRFVHWRCSGRLWVMLVRIGVLSGLRLQTCRSD